MLSLRGGRDEAISNVCIIDEIAFPINQDSQWQPIFLILGHTLKPEAHLAGVVEQVDTRDLKSLDLFGRAGSIPALGTFEWESGKVL